MGAAPPEPAPAPPRALLLDVFGTCVDWRSGIAAAAAAMGQRLGLPVDGPALADAWRARYQPQLETVRSGARPWVDLDVLHREALDAVLAEAGLEAVPGADRDALTGAWHRLDPWPDTVPALRRLGRRALVAPCSNGHVALVRAMAERAGLPWDLILGAEVAQAYKPQPAAYGRSVSALGLRPGEVMMVAAHNDDLVAAARAGLRTAFVARPREHGPGQRADLAPAGDWDLCVSDLGELADRLGA